MDKCVWIGDKVNQNYFPTCESGKTYGYKIYYNYCPHCGKEIEIIKEKEKKEIPEPPKMLPNKIIQKRILDCKTWMKDNIDYIKENAKEKKDFEHFCYENLIGCFYNVNDIWDWYNKVIE